MDNQLFLDRKLAAELAEAFYAGKIDFKELGIKYPRHDELNFYDEDIDNLYFLIEHKPAVGGLFGVSRKKHEKYMREIQELIEKLKT